MSSVIGVPLSRVHMSFFESGQTNRMVDWTRELHETCIRDWNGPVSDFMKYSSLFCSVTSFFDTDRYTGSAQDRYLYRTPSIVLNVYSCGIVQCLRRPISILQPGFKSESGPLFYEALLSMTLGLSEPSSLRCIIH